MAATVSTRITRLQAISPRQVATNLQADLTIGDFRLGADYMRDAANSFGLASTVTAGDDVRFWAGATFANRGTAPARIYESGNFSFGTGTKTLVWDGSDLSLGGASLVAGTAASTVVSNAAAGAAEAGALAAAAAKLAKAGGDILTGIIDVQQTTNYNAAIRTGDIAWNTTTGAITGGSGVAMTRLGLIGAAAGVTKFSINATTGAALFGGELSAPSGSIGGFNLGADYLRDAANSFGMAATVTGGDDVRFWAGDTFANRATAPFRLTESGALTAASITTAATTATWAGVSGSGKPADNADVTAANTAAGIASQGALATKNTTATADINTDAATELGSAYTDGLINIDGGNTSVQSITVTTHGYPVVILGDYSVNEVGGNAGTAQLQIYRDSFGTLSGAQVGVPTTASVYSLSKTVADSPAAGTYTYRIYATTPNAGSSPFYSQAHFRSLIVWEKKR